MGKLVYTKELEKFEMSSFNRDVEKYRALRESMKRHGYIAAYPLHCVRYSKTGKLVIKAGHHRLTVAAELGIGVWYVVCNDRATIPELEAATNPWDLDDYKIAFVREGRHEYLTVAQYQERTGIPLSRCVSLLAGDSAGSGNWNKRFKTGQFRLGDASHATDIADIVGFCKSNGIDWASNALFVQALSKIARVPEFDTKQFKRKVKSFRLLMEKQPNLQKYIEMIDIVYNRQSQIRIPLAFLADKVARERSAAIKPNPESAINVRVANE